MNKYPIFRLLYCVLCLYVNYSYTQEIKIYQNPMLEILEDIENPNQIMLYHYDTKDLIIYKNSDSIWNSLLIEVVKNNYAIDSIDIDLIVYNEKAYSIMYNMYVKDSLFYLCEKQLPNLYTDMYTSGKYSYFFYKNYNYKNFIEYPGNLISIYVREKFGYDVHCIIDIISLGFMNIYQSSRQIKHIYKTNNQYYFAEWFDKY